MNITELTAKVEALQTTLDTEQQQVKDAIAGLETIIAELKENATEGGTAEERQALADKLDGIKSDLESTIPDSEEEPE